MSDDQDLVRRLRSPRPDASRLTVGRNAVKAFRETGSEGNIAVLEGNRDRKNSHIASR